MARAARARTTGALTPSAVNCLVMGTPWFRVEMQKLERPEEEKREARSHGHRRRPWSQGSTPCDDRRMNAARVRQIPVFRHLSQSELERIAGWLQSFSIPEGE